MLDVYAEVFLYLTYFSIPLFVVVWLVVNLWPFKSVPKGKFGVEIIGKEQTAEIVAQGERGIQPRLLPASTSYFRWRRQVFPYDMTVVPEDRMGVVTACAGKEAEGKIAPYNPQYGHFTDPEAFLAAGGQQGVQAFLLPPGCYAIHPDVFKVDLFKQVVIPDDGLGIVTAHIGPSDRAASGDNPRYGDFTDIKEFLAAGGRQGVQEALLPPGTYNIHPFAFEILVIDDGDSGSYPVYGERASVTDPLVDMAPYTVQTEEGTAIVIEPEGKTAAVQMLGDLAFRCDRLVRFVIRPSARVTIEWEVAVAPDTESRVATFLNKLTLAAFGPQYVWWRVTDFAANLGDLEKHAQAHYSARITEAVMLPTALARALNA